MAKMSRYGMPGPNAALGELIGFVREAMLGRVNVAGEVTLAAGTTTTKIYDFNVTGTTVASLTPRSASAALIRPYQLANTKGTINLGHAAPGADVEFYYSLIG
jgi:hypothetical protein